MVITGSVESSVVMNDRIPVLFQLLDVSFAYINQPIVCPCRSGIVFVIFDHELFDCENCCGVSFWNWDEIFQLNI